MQINSKDFRVRAGSRIKLKEWPTRVAPAYDNPDHYQKLLQTHVKNLSAQQERLYASDRYAILLIFQAMDAAGKDGVIKHVMSGVNPQGCQVFSYKHPSATELKHDFLWRTTRDLPERGKIGIFNRSYYEEVLIVRVHPEILHAEGLPDAMSGREKPSGRSAINRSSAWSGIWSATAPGSSSSSCIFPRRNNASASWRASTRRRRTGNSAAPMSRNASIWKHYMSAFEDCLGATSTGHAPWYVVPADDKLNARLICSQIVLDTVADLRLAFPKTSPSRRRELKDCASSWQSDMRRGLDSRSSGAPGTPGARRSTGVARARAPRRLRTAPPASRQALGSPGAEGKRWSACGFPPAARAARNRCRPVG